MTNARHTPGGPSDASRPSVPNGHLFPLNNHGNLAYTAAVFKHLFEFLTLSCDVYKLRVVTIGQPGLVRVRSTHLSINHNFCGHGFPPYESLKNVILALLMLSKNLLPSAPPGPSDEWKYSPQQYPGSGSSSGPARSPKRGHAYP